MLPHTTYFSPYDPGEITSKLTEKIFFFYQMICLPAVVPGHVGAVPFVLLLMVPGPTAAAQCDDRVMTSGDRALDILHVLYVRMEPPKSCILGSEAVVLFGLYMILCLDR